MAGTGWRQLPLVVKQDSDVIRHPDEVDSRTDLLH